MTHLVWLCFGLVVVVAWVRVELRWRKLDGRPGHSARRVHELLLRHRVARDLGPTWDEYHCSCGKRWPV